MNMDLRLLTLKRRWLTDIPSAMEFMSSWSFQYVCPCIARITAAFRVILLLSESGVEVTPSIYIYINKKWLQYRSLGIQEMTGIHWLTQIFHSAVPTVHWPKARFLACVLQRCCEIVFLEVCQTFIQIAIINRYITIINRSVHS